MGVNLFIPVKLTVTPAQIETLVNVANMWGAALDAFDWCDLFKGNGGGLLTLAQALAFEPQAAPWFVMTVDQPNEFFTIASAAGLPDTWGLHETEFFWCNPNAKCTTSQSGPADWRALLSEANCDGVLFCKARN